MKRWRPIPGYEGLYEISDLGRVRSLKRTVMRSNGSPMSIPGRIRKTPPNRGYPTLVLHRGGFRENFAVHTLVALVFIGPRPPGTEVAHWDGDPSNPRLSNLRYATPIENDSDKIRHGTRSAGERNGRSRLKKSDIIEIRARVARGEMQGVGNRIKLQRKNMIKRCNIAGIRSRSEGFGFILANGRCFMSGLPCRHLKFSTTVYGKLA